MEQTTHYNFDTYKYIKALVAQGMQEPQAEIIINSIADSREIDLSHLSTKEQFIALEKSTREQFIALKEQMATKEQLKDLEIKIVQSHASTIKWMVGTVIAFSGITIAAIPLIIKYL